MKQTIFSKYNQSGRGMIEILGTLAIIGVISVGGLLGYSYGMDRYRANQAINDISLRGMDILSAEKTMTISNYEQMDELWNKENETIYPTSFFYDEEYGRFGIQMTGIPSSVCRLIGDNIPEHIETRIEIEGEEHELEEHIEECNLSNDNTMHFFFTPRQCVPQCHNNEVCVDGKCYGLECQNPKDCNPGYTGMCSVCSLGRCDIAVNSNGTACKFEDGRKGFCSQGTCVPKADDGCTYTTNVCTGEMYCASPNTSLAEAFPNGETGTCTEPRFDRYVITVNGVRETWHISENSMSYWDTVAACEAKNWTLPSMSDFTNSWSGGEGSFTRSTRAKNLNEATGELVWPTVWTTAEGTDGTNTVHYWIDLTTDYQNINYAGRNQSNYYYAACKEKNSSSDPIIPEQCTYDIDPCPDGYYCTSPNTSLTTAFPDGKTGSCVIPQFNEYTITVGGVQETWYISKETMSYWDASAACATKKLTILPATSWVNNWTGEGTFAHNERAQKLAEAIGSYPKKPKVWTTSQTTNGDGLPVFYWVNITDKGSDRWNVSWAGREHSQTYFAACKKP